MRVTRRRLLLGTLPAALLAAACGGGKDGARSEGVRTATSDTGSGGALGRGAVPAAASATPASRLDPADLRGFAFPIAGACLPDSDLLMPNAPREYRQGVHEGVDFYPGLACAPIEKGTPVLAMYAGRVVRADRDYRDLTPESLRVNQARVDKLGYSDEEALDVYRGRQVWVDHGGGIITRYAHLASITDGIAVGTPVEQGRVLGGVGESGTPESVTAPGTEIHLHAEVRIGDSFLGKGLPPAEVRALYVRIFAPDMPSASARTP